MMPPSPDSTMANPSFSPTVANNPANNSAVASATASASSTASSTVPTAVPTAIALTTTSRHDRSRTQSISSDRRSTLSHTLMSPPLTVTPEAAFIAASAASQIVTNDHDSHSEAWYDQFGVEPSGDTASVSPGALQLANNFVDQLLFNIISVAGSTSLSALRPAVSDVLKPKLAKDAINQADEELREYLGGGEVDDIERSPATNSARDWDVELAWKRTRLRCMVYSSLGDMEEEDEDYYMEQEHLRGESDDILTEFVSPAVAIFLTSILEFMGEQVLVISGQAAFNRLRAKYEKELKDGVRSRGEVAERLFVEELDMERVALDRTLGRLWRAWKKRIRSPLEPNFSRPFSRSSNIASSLTHTRQNSTAAATAVAAAAAADRAVSSAPLREELRTEKEEELKAPQGENESHKVVEELRPSAIPLPISSNDVAEIEVPGLVSYSDDEASDDDDGVVQKAPRPKSSIFYFQTPQPATAPRDTFELYVPSSEIRRGRSNSVPTMAWALPKAPTESAPKTTQPEIEQQSGENTKNGDVVTTSSPDKVETKEERPVGPISPPAQGANRAAKRAPPRNIVDKAEIEDLEEEPQILTSSRISIGGRSSPAHSDLGIVRPPSLFIARSNSVGSARLIDVQSPRTPSGGSRTALWEAELSRSTNLSRESSNSTPTPPIPEEQDQPIPPTESEMRRGPVPPTDNRLGVNHVAAPVPRSRTPPKSVPAQPTAPAPAPAAAPVTKITILSHPTPRSSSLPENQSEEIYSKLNQRTAAPLPPLPEKSTGRQTQVQANVENRPVVTPTGGSPQSSKVSRPTIADSPSSTASKFKNVRSSEDSGSHSRDFEELMKSDQTLQYTLTPENMRDTSSSKSGRSAKDSSPVMTHRTQRSEDVRPTTQRSRSSSLKRTFSLSKSAGLNSHPPDMPSHGKHTGPGSKPPVSMPRKPRSGSTARDARVIGDSTHDFADFIRSTGPQGPGAPPSRIRTGSVANARHASPPVPPKSAGSSTRPATSSTQRIRRLQARDATTTSNGSSELIDFIRQGPQNPADSQPRIPRHVAPFRSTMDSDQMQMSGASGGRAIDAVLPNVRDSHASTNLTEASAPSSTNSQSALLKKVNRPVVHASNNFDDDDMVPKRKQRRVRDPYAIDLSDEDEEDLDLFPPPKPKKEESLIDFLNNYEPPPEPAPKPKPPPTLPKKKSAPSLMTRLRSGGHSASGSFAGLTRRTSNIEARSLHSRASTTKGYTPISVNIPSGSDKLSDKLSDKFGIEPPPPPRPQPQPPSGRVPMKKFEPRDAHLASTATSDLASFLRDSEPPPSTLASSVTSHADDKSGGGISRMFERRKKSSMII